MSQLPSPDEGLVSIQAVLVSVDAVKGKTFEKNNVFFWFYFSSSR